ncbi:hypothetical protein C7377_1823 [Balneicella halophila]|uniref:VanZ like protein n=1 Tax=Balneicella halophila TaxID=1537566 RepID=A0A7L4UMF3_BALHA|nr:hypothetical protein [Balneicella halophila]PVX49406.1 hypothetical protein C7377_1823 [Balneicella halophila]
MELDKIIKSLKFFPKIWTALSFLLLLLINLTLFFGRNFENIRIGSLLKIMPDFYNHISNFSLCFIIYITIGYVGVMFGMTFKHLILIGAFILFLTLIIELLIPFLNTPDKTDAVFGILGVFLGFGFLYVIKNYGLKKTNYKK